MASPWIARTLLSGSAGSNSTRAVCSACSGTCVAPDSELVLLNAAEGVGAQVGFMVGFNSSRRLRNVRLAFPVVGHYHRLPRGSSTYAVRHRGVSTAGVFFAGVLLTKRAGATSWS